MKTATKLVADALIPDTRETENGVQWKKIFYETGFRLGDAIEIHSRRPSSLSFGRGFKPVISPNWDEPIGGRRSRSPLETRCGSDGKYALCCSTRMESLSHGERLSTHLDKNWPHAIVDAAMKPLFPWRDRP